MRIFPAFLDILVRTYNLNLSLLTLKVHFLFFE